MVTVFPIEQNGLDGNRISYLALTVRMVTVFPIKLNGPDGIRIFDWAYRFVW